MDEHLHQYELDISHMMSELAEQLSARGYCTLDGSDAAKWVFETRWRRGAAYGEIGSVLYGLVADALRELE